MIERFGRVAVGLMLLAGPCAHGQPGGPARATRQQIQGRLDQAWTAGDWAGVESLLAEAWEADPAWARETCFTLTTSQVTHARPVGAVMLGRHGAVADLAGAARALDKRQFPDERRFLVRSIGVRAESEEDKRPALEAIRMFLGDQDFLVRGAAALSLADLKRPADLALIAGDLREPPAYKNTDTINERESYNRAGYGAVRAVAGLRARGRAEVERWLADPVPVEPVATGALPPPGNWNGQAFYPTPSFDVYFRIAGLKGAPDDGPLAWPALPKTVEGAAAAASRAMARILGGPPHEPVIRLYLCDPREFNARAGMIFFAGVTKSNEIVVKIDAPGTLGRTLVHEYIHCVHNNAFADQPRWVSEGLATSLTESHKESVWRTRRPAGELPRMIERGIFSEMVSWNSGGSSDSKEGARYSLAHLAIDFLRFGGFAVPEERLGFLLGRLSRHEAATRALEAIYGLNIKALDRRAAEWLKQQ